MTTPEQEAQQGAFDIVTNHLMTQGKKSQAIGGRPLDDLTCAYRSSNGLKCAIGCLIPDDEYSQDFEGDTVRGLVDEDGPPTLKKLAQATGRNFLSCLQEVHDDHIVEQWPKALRNVAFLYNLDASKVPMEIKAQ